MPHWINATWPTDSLCKAGISLDFDFTLGPHLVSESVGAALLEVDETRAVGHHVAIALVTVISDPEPTSRNTPRQPACLSASNCRARFRSSVETRA